MRLKQLITACIPSALHPLVERLEASPLGYRLARGAFWSFAGALVARCFALVASILVARTLGKVVFGKFGILQSTVGMFILFAGYGLGLTATKHVAQYLKSDRPRTGRVIGISILVAGLAGLVLAIGLFLGADWLACTSLNAPELTPILRIGSCLLFLGALNGAVTGALSGFEAFKRIAGVDFLGGICEFPLLVGGAYFGGLPGVVWGMVITQSLFFCLNYRALCREAKQAGVKITLVDARLELPIIWGFSLPAVLCSAMVGPVNWVCATLLVNQPGGYGEMGIFNAANNWRTFILIIPATVGHIVLPILTSLRHSQDHRAYRQVFWINLALNGGIALLVALIIWPLSSFIMDKYGKGFVAGDLILTVLALSAVLIAMNNVIGQVIASHNRMWLGFCFNLGWATTLILSTYFFLQWGYGAMGVALANLIAYFCHSIWQGIFILTQDKHPPKENPEPLTNE